jgi:hypothetical protein
MMNNCKHLIKGNIFKMLQNGTSMRRTTICAVTEYFPNCIFVISAINCIYALFYAVPFKVVPLQTEAEHPATASLAEVPCFESGKHSLQLFLNCDVIKSPPSSVQT